MKKDRTLVTQLDAAAERMIVKIIRDTFPSHGILCEEGSAEESDGEYLWIIDPIDGTAVMYKNWRYIASNGLVHDEIRDIISTLVQMVCI